MSHAGMYPKQVKTSRSGKAQQGGQAAELHLFYQEALPPVVCLSPTLAQKTQGLLLPKAPSS